MYTNPQKLGGSDVQELRQRAGIWLKALREKAGLSQRQLAKHIGAEYYTFVSQIENGRGRVPPDRYESWAQAVSMPSPAFVRELMRFYDPVTHQILFGKKSDE